MRLALPLAALLVSAVLAPGCAQGGGGPDSGGGGLDAGPRPDAFVPRPDAGPDPIPDAGARDAGATPDAGAMDGGTTDAGRDAGMSLPDAGRDAGGGSCGESPCRLSPPQCGCSGGQGCYPTMSGRECRAAGTTGEGGTCGAASDCQAGMVCDDGLCARICLSNADCPGRGSECRSTETVGPNTLQTCTIPCEPATGDGCPSGQACRYFDGGSTYFTDCVPEGSDGPNVECETSSECTRNHTCVFFDPFGIDPGSCTQTCRLGGFGDCLFCVAFLDQEPIIDGTEYGLCAE